MKRHLVLAFAVLICAVANLATAQQLITPVNAGLVNSPVVVVNNNLGGQRDPHISGDLMTYTDDEFGAGQIHYFNFLTGADSVVPGDLSRIDTFSSIDGTRIAFSRQTSDRNAIFVYDTATSSLTEIDPQPGSARFYNAIGGSRVAFTDHTVGFIDVLVHDLLTDTTLNLSANGATIDTFPNVAPDGNAVVWQNCNGSGTVCEVYAGLWQPQPPAWIVARVSKRVCSFNASACFPIPAGFAHTPDTDGNWIVYVLRPANDPIGSHILFQPLAGDGIERQLVMGGRSFYPRIDHGVIAFGHTQSTRTPTDLFVYHIATNRLYQITDTPFSNETLSDVTVLPNGDIRVAWEASDGEPPDDGAGNVYATTFAPASVGSGPDTAVIGLMNLLSSTLGLKQGQINSLTDKLSNVLASIDQGLYKQAINQITAFIKQVEAAVRAHQMNVDTAAPLLAVARDILKALS